MTHHRETEVQAPPMIQQPEQPETPTKIPRALRMLMPFNKPGLKEQEHTVNGQTSSNRSRRATRSSVPETFMNS